MTESNRRIEAEMKTLYVDPQARVPYATTAAARTPTGAKKEY
jgi:hypothetical protein